MIDFQTHPDKYKHWKLEFKDDVAFLKMDVDENATLFDGYELKLNSYDLGVDIELHDAIQRLRFEHPEIKTVVLSSNKDKIFCAGANIRMLGGAAHAHKVNFCKFTNETRLGIEDATENSKQTYMCAINGTAAGGGYELALATDHIILVDDGNAVVSLPEIPLLAVLPGTGGLTRVVDKRKTRRDLADYFCTTEEGVAGQRAKDWRLVDEVVPTTKFEETIMERAKEFAKKSDRPSDAKGVELTPLNRKIDDDKITYDNVTVEIDRKNRWATITVKAPDQDPPKDADEMHKQGAGFWPLAMARDLDDAILHMRLNEMDIGTLLLKTEGDADKVEAYDKFLLDNQGHWLGREITLFLKRVMKRLDTTSRTMFAILGPGSCFTGTLAEMALAADRGYMLEGEYEGDNRPPPTIRLTDMNFGTLAMGNGLSRLETRLLGEPDTFEEAKKTKGKDLEAEDALKLGLVTFAPDDIDWDEELRVSNELRSSFSADALTGMEANLRFAGPETMETKIFGRLTAWQNWIFQRPNAVGEQGALQLYGTGKRADYNTQRV